MLHKYIQRVLLFLLISGATTACKKSVEVDDFGSKFKYPIPAVTLTSSASVGAYYYNYSSSDWNKKQADTSLLGKPYNAITNPEILPQQLSWADEGGVDYFIFKWNGSATDNDLLNAFASARTNQKVRMVIDYNTAHLSATNASPLEGAKLDKLLAEFTTLVQNHISKGYYFTVENKPVIMLSPLNLSSSTINSINYKEVVNALRSSLQGVGIDPFIIGELTTGWVAPVNYDAEMLKAMDAIVITTWNTLDYDRWWAFYSFVDLSYQNWKTTLEKMGVEFVPCIFPGFEDPSSSSQRAIARTEANYIDYTNVAKRSMGEHQLVIVNSWNDFMKGTSLEPATEYGAKYLELTKKAFKVQ